MARRPIDHRFDLARRRCAVGVIPMVVSTVYAGFIRGRGSCLGVRVCSAANAAGQLVMLCVILATGISVGVGWVMISFCIGNVVAFVLALVYIARWMRSPHSAESGRDYEAKPRRILAFSLWLSLSNAAVIALGIVPRIALAHVSYARVAAFDLALLLYRSHSGSSPPS